MANIISNFSFETDTAGWTMDADWVRSSQDAYDKSWSIKQISASGFNNFTTQNDSDSRYAVSANQPYTFSFYYKLTITSGFGPNIEIHDDTPFAGNVIGSTALSATATWVQVKLAVKSSTGFMSFRMYNNDGNVVGFYDMFNLDIANNYTTAYLGSFR